ncbi:hypoxanthine phosphoribosyltransferase [Enhydrobacter aerosaccus]|uniref:Hypoxanthine phosphoribosyltransferase n=1 Tax=Enhydrobacter aerosaccus TaxID=225324 RepID=A0A1T4JX30_9HYPH|nr:hypoxanthine phosphoribosyltransferase [Enhydrobacter aerosaccus]SJZ34812.1 hypoxanthine phosphoribosyltransferase [Enhydrobacter aerosaccus]
MANRTTVSIRFSAAEIATRVEDMAADLSQKLPPDTLVVSVLKGSFVFAADLIRALSRAGADWAMDFITLSSYGAGTQSSGQVRVVRDIVDDVRDRDVLLVDDILESGLTLSFARNLLKERGARRVWICTLLDKPHKRRADLKADFVGFEAGDEFLVGYGLDWAHRFRGLPYIGVVEAAA